MNGSAGCQATCDFVVKIGFVLIAGVRSCVGAGRRRGRDIGNRRLLGVAEKNCAVVGYGAALNGSIAADADRNAGAGVAGSRGKAGVEAVRRVVNCSRIPRNDEEAIPGGSTSCG